MKYIPIKSCQDCKYRFADCKEHQVINVYCTYDMVEKSNKIQLEDCPKVNGYFYDAPSWCPLQDLPEDKKNDEFIRMSSQSFMNIRVRIERLSDLFKEFDKDYPSHLQYVMILNEIEGQLTGLLEDAIGKGFCGCDKTVIHANTGLNIGDRVRVIDIFSMDKKISLGSVLVYLGKQKIAKDVILYYLRLEGTDHVTCLYADEKLCAWQKYLIRLREQ